MKNIKNGTVDVKEMLLGGATKDELMKALEDEIDSAQEEIDNTKAEKEKKDAAIDQLRMNLIKIAIDYMNALGLIEGDKIESKDYEELNQEIKQIEKQMEPQLTFLDSIRKNFDEEKKERKIRTKVRNLNKTMEDADELIRQFLKSL